MRAWGVEIEGDELFVVEVLRGGNMVVPVGLAVGVVGGGVGSRGRGRWGYRGVLDTGGKRGMTLGWGGDSGGEWLTQGTGREGGAGKKARYMRAGI